MNVLIVENTPELGALWQRHLTAQGMEVRLASTADEAQEVLRALAPSVIIVDLDLPGSGAVAVADYAAYRRPDSRVIFVTAQSFFSDGSIFSISPNACAFVPSLTPPEDLAALVEFHGSRAEAS